MESFLADDTHYDLLAWGNWARDNRIAQTNVLSRMMQRRLDDMPASGYSEGGFPLHIEVIDKSVAVLKNESRWEYKFVMKYYLGRMDYHEIATEMWRDPEWVRQLHKRAIASIARIRREVKNRLTVPRP